MKSTHPTALALTIMIGTAIAGPLDPPPGPISSTGKTIAETEPRTAINAMNTPGDANSAFKITQSGSYYLTQNYLILGLFDDLHAIEIAADNVTIDLNGFSLTGLSGALSGIVTDGGDYEGITIRNGTIQSFDYGIDLDRNDGTNVTIEDLKVFDSTFKGILLTSGHVRRCIVKGNGSTGIEVTSNAIIEGCTSTDNDRHGIDVGVISIIRDCIVRSNFNDGIQVSSSCIVRDNVVTSNGIQTGINAGIQVFGSDSLIRDNVITGNEFGIRSDTVSVFTQNILSGNVIDISVSPANPGLADESSSPSGAGPWDNIVLP